MEQTDSFIDIFVAKAVYNQRLPAPSSLAGNLSAGNIKDPLPSLVHDGSLPKYVSVHHGNREAESSAHCTELQTRPAYQSNLHSSSGHLKNLQTISSTHCSELQTMSSGNRSELQTISTGHPSELQIMSSGHRSELQTISSGHHSELQTISSGHHSELQTISTGHHSELQTMSSGHHSELQPSFPSHSRDMQTVFTSHQLQPALSVYQSDTQPSFSSHDRNLQTVTTSQRSGLKNLSSRNTILQPSSDNYTNLKISSQSADVIPVSIVPPQTATGSLPLFYFRGSVPQCYQPVDARKPSSQMLSNPVYLPSQHNASTASKGERHTVSNAESSQSVLNLTRGDRYVPSNECLDLHRNDVGCVSKNTESSNRQSDLLRPDVHPPHSSSYFVDLTSSDKVLSQKSASVAKTILHDGFRDSSDTAQHSGEVHTSKHSDSSYMVSNFIQSDGHDSVVARISCPQTSMEERTLYSQTPIDARTSFHKDSRTAYPVLGLNNADDVQRHDNVERLDSVTNRDKSYKQTDSLQNTTKLKEKDIQLSDMSNTNNSHVISKDIDPLHYLSGASHTVASIQEKDPRISKPLQSAQSGKKVKPGFSVSNIFSGNISHEKQVHTKVASMPTDVTRNVARPKHSKVLEDFTKDHATVYKPRALISYPSILTKGKIVPPNVTKNVVERPAHLQGSLSHIIGIDPRMSMRQIIQNTAIGGHQKRVLDPKFSASSSGTESRPSGPLLMRPSQIFDPLYHSTIPQFEKLSQPLECHSSQSLGLQVPQASLHRGLPDKESTSVPFVSMVVCAESVRPAIAFAVHEPQPSIPIDLVNKESCSRTLVTRIGSRDMVRPPLTIALHESEIPLVRGLSDRGSCAGSHTAGLDIVRPPLTIALHESEIPLVRGLSDRGSFTGSHATGLVNVRPPETSLLELQSSLYRGVAYKDGDNGPLLNRFINTESVRPLSVLGTQEPQLLLPLPQVDSSDSFLTRLTPRSYDNEQILLSPPYRPFSVSSFMSFDPHSEQTPQVTYNDLQMSIFGERLDPFLEQFFSDQSSDVSKVHCVMLPGNRTNTKSGSNDASVLTKSDGHSRSSVNNAVHDMLDISSPSIQQVNKATWTSSLHNVENSDHVTKDMCRERPDSIDVTDQGNFSISNKCKSISVDAQLKQDDNQREKCANVYSKTAKMNQDNSASCNDGANPAEKQFCSSTVEATNKGVTVQRQFTNDALPIHDDLNIQVTMLDVETPSPGLSESIANVKSGLRGSNTREIQACLETENSEKDEENISLNYLTGDCEKYVYRCNHCPESFKNSLHLKDHEIQHSSEKLYKCSECFKCYKDSSSLKRHARVHSGKRNHKCAVCGKAFLDSYALESHIRVHTKEKVHLCSVCEKSFSHASELQVHKSSHTGIRPYVCSKCGKGFSKSSKLQVHDRCHTGEKPFSCEYCSKAFAVSSNLKVHMRTHTGPASYKCEACKQLFSEKEELNNHMKTHSDFISYNCHLCPRKFVELSRLEEHKSVHTGEKCVQCLVCKKMFKKVHKLISHQVMMHQEKETFSCDVCQKDFSSGDDLSAHRMVHSENPSSSLTSDSTVNCQSTKPHQCDICKKTFVRFVDLREHLNTHTGQKPNKCVSCGQGFCSRGGLRKHIRNCHKENSSIVGNTTAEPRKNVCEICGKIFKQFCHLKVHKRIHYGEKPYKCEFCGKMFRDSGIRNRHIRTHTGEKPHQCKVCMKSFVDSGSLQKHTAVHTKPKNHVCKTCGKGFNFQGDLQVHIRSHSGDKPFKCESCGKAFAKSSKLVIHRRIHTGEKPYKCTVCNRSFSVSSNLRAHVKTHASLTTYSCSTCSRIFYCSEKLDQHVREAHSSITMIPCPQCDKSFAEEYRLKEHLFTHNNVKSFQCSQCDKSFIRLHNLQLHQSFHSAVKTHICQKCNSSFYKDSDLQKHMHIHDTTSSLRCEQCDIGFKTTKDLHEHFCGMHTQDRKFKCHHCSKGFRRKADFNIHIRTHTGLRPYKCNICNKGFCGKSGLRKHTMVNHT